LGLKQQIENRQLFKQKTSLRRKTVDKEDLIYRLRKRAEIRRQINTRKSVQEGAPDRIADLLEEAADALESKEKAHG